MRVGGLSTAEVALQLLTQQSSARPGATRNGTPASPGRPLEVGDGYGKATAAAIAAIQDLASGGSGTAASDAIAAVKDWAKSATFRSAAKGEADQQVRALVRDGKLPHLPVLDEAQYDQLSEAEKNIYGTVSVLQGLYDAQPKSLEQALSDHVKSVLEGYPESIARMKSELASGKLPASDGWAGIISDYEATLSAAQSGKMQIHAVTDPSLVTEHDEFSVHNDGVGWSGSGVRTQADIPALQKLYGTPNVLPGSSPYFGSYVITW